MTTESTPIEKRLRVCGILVLLGLVVGTISLWWSHPTAFLVFVFVGGFFLLLGILLYLYSLVTLPPQRT
jgi:hypothetical protein